MKLTFHGGIREVGGSNILLETDMGRIALDYGIKVEDGLEYNMKKDLDLIIISHAHLDHSGNLFITAEEKTSILGSAATRDVTLELLKDMITVHKRDGKPIPYTDSDVNNIAERWIYREKYSIPGVEIFLFPAGHVLGANMVFLKTNGKKILYTGDFCLHNSEILDGARIKNLPEKPDILIMESTYGGKTRPSRDKLLESLFDNINLTISNQGNILLPTFAFHRFQEMAFRINNAISNGRIPRYDTYLISRLAQRITTYFKKYKNLLNPKIKEESLQFNKLKKARKLNQITEPALVICTPGFGHAGTSLKLLGEWVEEKNNLILINTGYLPQDSPLLIMKEKGYFESNDNKIKVNAKVEQIELSGHADQSELIEFVKGIQPKQIFLVHGEPDQMMPLSKALEEFTQTTIPQKDETFEI